MKDDLVLLDICQVGNTVVLSLSGEHTFELAQDSVPADLPGVGGRIDSPLLAELQSAADRKLAAREVFRLLDRRLYPRAVLIDKLVERGIGHDIAEAVLTQFEARGIHSDLQFAVAFCRDTLRRGPRGSRYLRDKLRRKRVAQECVRSAIEQELPVELETGLAHEAAVKRWRRHGDRPVDRKAIAGVVRFLIGRGFPAGTANDAARAAAPDNRPPNEEERF